MPQMLPADLISSEHLRRVVTDHYGISREFSRNTWLRFTFDNFAATVLVGSTYFILDRDVWLALHDVDIVAAWQHTVAKPLWLLIAHLLTHV